MNGATSGVLNLGTFEMLPKVVKIATFEFPKDGKFPPFPSSNKKMLVDKIVDGFVTAVTFKTLDLIMPDRLLEEQKRYNNVTISLERESLEWDKRWICNELEQAQREKNEARQSETERRIRLANRPALKYQPSKTFNEIRASVMVTLGVGTGLLANKLL